MLCHLLTKLELTASASMAQRLTDDCVCQWVKPYQKGVYCMSINIFNELPEYIAELIVDEKCFIPTLKK